MSRKRRSSGSLITQDSTLKKMQTMMVDPYVMNWIGMGGARGTRERILKINFDTLRSMADRTPIINAIIKDNGVTEFHGVQTATCICLGPDEAERIDLITGGYKLL